MAENESPRKSKLSKKIIIGVILAILLAVGIYFFLEYRKSQELLKNPNLAAQAEAQTLIAEIGKFMVLPDEEPTIATVSDATKLQDQAFFKNAKNGYKVLIYPKAQKAILYDPIIKKIVETGPVNLTPPQAANTTETRKEVTVALYNGTKTVGLTTTVEKQLKEKYPQIRVTEKANAAKSDYAKTTVVDITGQQKTFATELARLLGGEVGLIASGEATPKEAEILIILGK